MQRPEFRHLIPLLLLTSVFLTASAAQVRDSVLVIPAGTKAIAPAEFMDRTDFNAILFEQPCRVASIGENAFMGCTALRSVDLPASLTSMGNGAFRQCPELRHVSIPASLPKIPSLAFAYDSRLENVTIPSTVKRIGANAFSFCTSLTDMVLPAGLIELESYVFSECSSLRSVVFPSNNRLLGEMILYGDGNMRSVTVGSPVPPPFDCNSQLFDLEESDIYDRCTLYVPAGAEQRYASAPGWSHFKIIRPIDNENPR